MTLRSFLRAPVLCALALAGCDPGQPGHPGNPLLLPGHAVGNAARNATYNARRAKVELHVKTHHPAMIAEIETGGGPVLDEAMDLAGVAQKDREILVLRLLSDLALYRNSPDALVVALMAHGR